MTKIPTEENQKLNKWKSRLSSAKLAYQDTIDDMKKFKDYYDGAREVQGDHNTGKVATKVANNVWNIVYELVESQVDSSIPAPKVTAVHKQDAELAKKIEHFLVNEIKSLHMSKLNDIQERITPVMGGDFFQVEWDTSAGYHSTLGDLSVSERNPQQVIPQPGVTDMDKMDYLFILIPQTKAYVKSRYGVSVEDAEEESPDLREDTQGNGVTTDIVTVNIAYYKNGKGGIGCYTWCDDIVLEDMEDYQARQLEVCSKCGKVKTGDKCECGSKKFEKKTQDYEELIDSIEIKAIDEKIEPYEEISEPIVDETGNLVLDENGAPVMDVKRTKKKIPFYHPNCYSVIPRVNVSRTGYFLGYSDVKIIMDQQDNIKKLGSKVMEKLIKGGSIVTLPEGCPIKTTENELKVVYLSDPSKKALIDVVTLQPNVQSDLTFISNSYANAKSALGITDAYQGKYDSSATSGTAKQYSINQAAGRLESKRVMKNEAYAKLYEIMFKYLLAYADQKIPITYNSDDGKQAFDEFDRYQFLRIDDAGEFYWNDEFIFETDPTSTIMMNREAMWSSIDQKYQAGGFGAIGTDEALLLLWQLLEKNGYPNAGTVLRSIEQRVQKKRDMEDAQAQILIDQTGGNQDVMSEMQM